MIPKQSAVATNSQHPNCIFSHPPVPLFVPRLLSLPFSGPGHAEHAAGAVPRAGHPVLPARLALASGLCPLAGPHRGAHVLVLLDHHRGALPQGVRAGLRAWGSGPRVQGSRVRVLRGRTLASSSSHLRLFVPHLLCVPCLVCVFPKPSTLLQLPLEARHEPCRGHTELARQVGNQPASQQVIWPPIN